MPQVVLTSSTGSPISRRAFGVINLAIAHGRPAVLNLKETLAALRRAPPRRRHPPYRFELRQAEAQREIIEGLGVAASDIDLVVAPSARRPTRTRARRRR